MESSSAILIPTCDRYLPMAQLTSRVVDRFWRNHPPIQFCGVAARAGLDAIPTAADPRDWVGIAHEATGRLLARGVVDGYLVLDDHPPVAPCNEAFLNADLPALARARNAVCIGLSGWDQFHACPGEDLGPAGLHLRRLPAAFKWKFGLHPAWWNFQSLHDLLGKLHESSPRPLSAREFEAQTGSAQAPLRPEWLAAAYRVAGDRYSVGSGWMQARGRRALAIRALHARRWLTRGLAGQQALARFDTRMRYFTDFLNGPYPMFWSGLMQRGAPHAAAREFLVRTGQHAIVAELDRVVRQMETI
jgi:hypothetical protein